jgi:aminoglycoside phosphotransferase (APT) family kinase protein
VSEQPWDFDHELTIDMVVGLARACGLRAKVESLGAGWDFSMFVCDGQVLRVPKRVDAAEALERELTLLRSLPDELPLLTPRPPPDLVRVATLPYPCMVYPYVAGTPLDEVAEAPGAIRDAGGATHAERIGAQLGGFLRVLHNIVPTSSESNFDEDQAEWITDSMNTLESLRPTIGDHLTSELQGWLAEPLPSNSSRACLCHGDLLAEHILVGADGDAVAVIDWGDADVAAWWLDFVGLWMWGGDRCLNAALVAYGQRLTNHEQVHLRRRALMAAIGESDYHQKVHRWQSSETAVSYLQHMLQRQNS